MLLLATASAIVSLTGTVPPHRANDGRVYVATAPGAGLVEDSLRACAVADFAPLGGDAYQFALGPADLARADCVGARLGAQGRVELRARWVG